MARSTVENLDVLFEDNHIIIINKRASDIVQGDKTGDTPLSDIVKDYIKIKHNKPSNVFLGTVHRLDRPTSGIVIFAKTSKALTRLNKMFLTREIHKTYWAITKKENSINQKDTLINFLRKNPKQNKSYVTSDNATGSKRAVLHYEIIQRLDKYQLFEIKLETGRHHQIRTQLASIGCPIVGDLKYNYPRSNSDASICLHSRKTEFTHPVTKETISITAPLPKENLWKFLKS